MMKRIFLVLTAAAVCFAPVAGYAWGMGFGGVGGFLLSKNSNNPLQILHQQVMAARTATQIVGQTETVVAGFTHTDTATPTATPTYTVTSTFSYSPTATPSATPTDSPTATPTYTVTSTFSASPTATPSATPTASPTASPTSTVTPTATPTGTPTDSPTASPTSTVTPTATPTGTPSDTTTASPTFTSSPTKTVTVTATPTATPSATRTASPTASPTSTNAASPTITQTFTITPTPTPTGVVVVDGAINGGYSKVYAYRSGAWNSTDFPAVPVTTGVSALTGDTAGHLYAGDNGLVDTFAGGVWSQNNTLLSNIGYFNGLALDGSSNLIAAGQIQPGSVNGYLSVTAGTLAIGYNSGSDSVVSVSAFGSSVWVATNTSVLQIQGGTGSYTPSNHVYKIAMSSATDGYYTDSAKVYKISSNTDLAFTGTSVSDIQCAANGNLYVGGYNGTTPTVFAYNGTTWSALGTYPGTAPYALTVK